MVTSNLSGSRTGRRDMTKLAYLFPYPGTSDRGVLAGMIAGAGTAETLGVCSRFACLAVGTHIYVRSAGWLHSFS